MREAGKQLDVVSSCMSLSLEQGLRTFNLKASLFAGLEASLDCFEAGLTMNTPQNDVRPAAWIPGAYIGEANSRTRRAACLHLEEADELNPSWKESGVRKAGESKDDDDVVAI